MESSFWNKLLLFNPTTLRAQRSHSSSSPIFRESPIQSQMIHPERLKHSKDYVVVDCGATSLPLTHTSLHHCPECTNVGSVSSDDEDEPSTEVSMPIHPCRWHQRHHNLKRNMIRLLVLILIIILVSTILVLGLTLCSSFWYTHHLPPLPTTGRGNISELTLDKTFQDLTDVSHTSSAPSQETSESNNFPHHHKPSLTPPSLPSRTGSDGKKHKKLSSADKIEISRKTWELLNRNSAKNHPQPEVEDAEPENRIHLIPVPFPRPENVPRFPSSTNSSGGVILPAVMVYASSKDGEDEENLQDSALGHGQLVNNFLSFKKNNASRKNCCRSRKYMQTLHMEGCEPLRISNRICLGECVSVWVPGVFSSFPACRPSRSHWKVVTFTCGSNRDKKKRVKVEKIRRCSCMDTST